MANSEHVAKLQEGVEAWNAWREQNPDIRPDLREACLYRADLVGAKLNRVDLRWAKLAEADLRKAELRRANLTGVNLRETYLNWVNLTGARLTGANLIQADFSGAGLAWTNLVQADLSGADLSGVNLSGAKLDKADFSEAILAGANLSGANLNRAVLFKVRLYETIFANVDLTNVEGLESCIHHGPSIIDHRTLERSGKLPLSFLQRCGLPDTFIDHLPSLLDQPIQFYSCFISYASEDEALAKRLHADLQDKGVRCWFAPEDLKIGDKFRVRIGEAIQTYEKLLLLLSEYSMTSTWVEDEVEAALERESECKDPILFPIRLDDTVMESETGWAAAIRRSCHVGDFCNWKDHDEYQKGLERLLRDLEIEKGE